MIRNTALSRATDQRAAIKQILMEFFKHELYHIYNRGNNQQKIFFKPDNYIFFLTKLRRLKNRIICFLVMRSFMFVFVAVRGATAQSRGTPDRPDQRILFISS